MTYGVDRLNGNMLYRRIINLKSVSSRRDSAIAVARKMQIRCIFPIRCRWCSIIKVWFSHPSNSLRPLRYPHRHIGTPNRFHSTTRNRLTSVQWQAAKRFPRNREKEQTSITDLPHPNNPTPVWKALYPFHRPIAPDTCVIPFEFYTTAASLSCM